jgi:hypothetical protein
MTTTNTTKTKTGAQKKEAGLRARIGDARHVAGEFGGAMTVGSRAYVGGLMELGRTLGGFGREVLNDAGEHVRATIRAKNLREVAELQASYAQHRIEMSATHSKEFVDLARVKSEEVIAPFADLLKQDKKAA